MSGGAGLSIDELETVYDELAQAIDAAGPERAQLMLVKLALLGAHAIGDAEAYRQLVAIALRDL